MSGGLGARNSYKVLTAFGWLFPEKFTEVNLGGHAPNYVDKTSLLLSEAYLWKVIPDLKPV